MYVTSIPDWFARDLSLERFAPLLIGKGIKTGSNTGVWSYEPVLFTQQQLHRAAEVVDLRDWEPLKASPFQCTLVALIGNGLTRKKVNQIAAKFPESDAAREVDALIKHGIVGWYDDTLVFLTIQCVTLFTSKGQAVVGDADDPRFFEWYGREQRRGVKAWWNCWLIYAATVAIHFVIADGIVAMEGTGPLNGNPRPMGKIVLADDQVAADATCARFMGFEAGRISYTREGSRFLGNDSQGWSTKQAKFWLRRQLHSGWFLSFSIFGYFDF